MSGVIGEEKRVVKSAGEKLDELIKNHNMEDGSIGLQIAKGRCVAYQLHIGGQLEIKQDIGKNPDDFKHRPLS